MNVSIVVLTALVASVAASGLLVGGVVLLLRLRTFDASTRHALWLATIVAMALLPLAGVGASIARRVQPGSSIAAVLPGAAHTLRSRSAASDVRSLSAPSRHQTAITSHAVPQRTRGTTVTTSPQTALGALGKVAWAASLIALAALAGVALTGLVLLALSVAQIGAVKRRSSPLDETLSGDLPWLTETHRGRETYLRLSYEIEAPVAIGFSRPVILIPTELATKSGLAAIEDLVIHEHAHLRRYDDYTNLIQRVIERTFWFNPFVWFAGRRIALEREIAADDAVVERTSDRTRYADQLWRLAREMRMPAYTVVAPGALFTRKQISIRIEALLAPGRTHLRHLGPASAAGVLALALVSYALVAVAAPPLLLPAAAPSASSDAGSAGSRTVSWHAFDDNVRNSTARTADQTILALTSLSGFVSSRLTDVAAAADAPGASSSPDRIT
ncbi:MAG: M56 family metallopeptidase, partial [Candidatus Eremiobacteraeota bacterium]|nr:M56 family metallopeptidase [Candidatus Eremiobacteraeota bacterium]